ncbi:MAG: DUF1844 domain-containing protein [Myxococcales bacterium]|nr:DUF1844 domain-containing protein [Myxococcales bacterium]
MNEGETKQPDCEQRDCEESLSPMDFSTFVLSLASSAMVNLGIVDGEKIASSGADLVSAKQLIDILGVLEIKTRDNLSDPEDKLLKSLLYDLRVQYCDAQKRELQKD